MKQVKVKFIEMDQGHWDVYDVLGDEPKMMFDVEENDLMIHVNFFKSLSASGMMDVECTLITYKSFELLYDAHILAALDNCDSLYGGLDDDPDSDCYVCLKTRYDVQTYNRKVGVKW